MPTVLRVGPYRFYFWSSDRGEPPHIHVEHDRKRAKFWLDPVQLERSRGFSAKELRRLEAMIDEHAARFLAIWDEYFHEHE